MNRPILLATLAGASLLPIQALFAHGFAGPHMFVSTLIIDDPNVADEASLPTFSVLPQPNNGGPVSDLYAAAFEFDKRITEMRDTCGWADTTGSAKTWWDTFEQNNAHRRGLILRLLEELRNRSATIVEFYMTYISSKTDNIMANLHFLDYRRLKKEADKNKRDE